MADSLSLRVWGEFALFTRPELKVERVSYPMMTPSAARGILDAILFKPQMAWHVRRITVIEPNFPTNFPDESRRLPYRLVGVRRNEVTAKLSPRTVEGWIKEPSTFEPCLVDSTGRDGQRQNRAQRNSLVLQHVAYLIDATPVLTARANQPRQVADEEEDRGPDSVAKYVAMFQRRAQRGQCFHHPYLGCREFACHFALPNGSERPLSEWTESLGMMLYDIKFDPTTKGNHLPGFFQARIEGGVLHCDSQAKGPHGEAPIQVIGW